jgi:hypothetical protein
MVVISIATNLVKTSKQLTHFTILAKKPALKPYKLSDTERLCAGHGKRQEVLEVELQT